MNNYLRKSKWVPSSIKKFKFKIWRNCKSFKKKHSKKDKAYFIIILQLNWDKRMLALLIQNQELIMLIACLENKLNKIFSLKCSKKVRKWERRTIRKIKLLERKIYFSWKNNWKNQIQKVHRIMKQKKKVKK